jgi:hypothetical protein
VCGVAGNDFMQIVAHDGMEVPRIRIFLESVLEPRSKSFEQHLQLTQISNDHNISFFRGKET